MLARPSIVGRFVNPSAFALECLYDNVLPEMRIYQEEIFGSVLVVVRVLDFEAGIALIDNHEFGNGSAIFNRDGRAGRQFAERIQTGMVEINIPIPVPVAYHSFGGWKNSLFGDHHMHGPEGIRFFTRLKIITSRGPEGGPSTAQFSMPTMG